MTDTQVYLAIEGLANGVEDSLQALAEKGATSGYYRARLQGHARAYSLSLTFLRNAAHDKANTERDRRAQRGE